ncbi:MAG: hypothetical protein ACFB5Z_12785 [Elainellaceae cyanobacterium]
MTQATASIFDQVHQWMTAGGQVPPAERLVEALVAAEKSRRQGGLKPAGNQDGPSWTYADLLGQWRLSFITGTRTSRRRAGVVLGRGRFVPRWMAISLTYGRLDKALDNIDRIPPDLKAAEDRPDAQIGWVQNRVAIAAATLMVSGPTRLWPNDILAFDFTRMRVSLGDRTLVNAAIRDGANRESAFGQQALKQQAFFRYFLVNQSYIAARGRGGGLALWVREGAMGDAPPKIAR